MFFINNLMQYSKVSVYEYLIPKNKRERWINSEKTSREVYWQANNIRIAVAVMFPADLLQQPTTPVQNAENIARKATMNRAITDLPISAIKNFNVQLRYSCMHCVFSILMKCFYINEKFMKFDEMNVFMKLYMCCMCFSSKYRLYVAKSIVSKLSIPA